MILLIDVLSVDQTFVCQKILNLMETQRTQSNHNQIDIICTNFTETLCKVYIVIYFKNFRFLNYL